MQTISSIEDRDFIPTILKRPGLQLIKSRPKYLTGLDKSLKAAPLHFFSECSLPSLKKHQTKPRNLK
jgi:hypothetical protein